VKPSVKISLEEVRGALVIHAQGEVDLATAPNFQTDVFRSADEKRHHHHVIIDLTELGFFGTLGIDVLDKSQHHLQQHGQALIVVAAPRSISRRVLDLLGLAKQFRIMDSVSAAIGEAHAREGASGPRHPSD
jgi:anti-sigma B factor antagonist